MEPPAKRKPAFLFALHFLCLMHMKCIVISFLVLAISVSILVLLDLVTSYFIIICKDMLFSGGEKYANLEEGGMEGGLEGWSEGGTEEGGGREGGEEGRRGGGEEGRRGGWRDGGREGERREG